MKQPIPHVEGATRLACDGCKNHTGPRDPDSPTGYEVPTIITCGGTFSLGDWHETCIQLALVAAYDCNETRLELLTCSCPGAGHDPKTCEATRQRLRAEKRAWDGWIWVKEWQWKCPVCLDVFPAVKASHNCRSLRGAISEPNKPAPIQMEVKTKEMGATGIHKEAIDSFRREQIADHDLRLAVRAFQATYLGVDQIGIGMNRSREKMIAAVQRAEEAHGEPVGGPNVTWRVGLATTDEEEPLITHEELQAKLQRARHEPSASVIFSGDREKIESLAKYARALAIEQAVDRDQWPTGYLPQPVREKLVKYANDVLDVLGMRRSAKPKDPLPIAERIARRIGKTLPGLQDRVRQAVEEEFDSIGAEVELGFQKHEEEQEKEEEDKEAGPWDLVDFLSAKIDNAVSRMGKNSDADSAASALIRTTCQRLHEIAFGQKGKE